MMVRLEVFDPEKPTHGSDICHIARNLRSRDREEIFCTRWNEDAEQLGRECEAVARLPSSYTVLGYYNNHAVAILGGVEPWPGLWDIWSFGTNSFDWVAPSLTKHAHRVMIPTLLARGMRRAHCRSMEGHTKAHRWIRSLGARLEDERAMKGWGKNGENFIMFEWHREFLLEKYQPAEAA